MLNIVLNTEKYVYTPRRNVSMSKYVQPISTVTMTSTELHCRRRGRSRNDRYYCTMQKVKSGDGH
jgi:hypothetical protein